jgi:LPS sulfotransferase NodH
MNKFILLGHHRCGSTLLAGSLHYHQNVNMFGEIFNDNLQERRKAYSKGIIHCREEGPLSVTEHDYYESGDAAEFLERSIFFKRYAEPVAVGFKLFYNTCRDEPDMMKAWRYLVADKDLRVIHLYRRNLLESLLSLSIALITGQWHLPEGREPERHPAGAEPIDLPIEYCEEYFKEIDELRQTTREEFRDHQILEITYEEDLSRSYQETYARVCNFIGVPREEAEVTLLKQAMRKPAEQINNYAELQRHFAKTRYAQFFEQ